MAKEKIATKQQTEYLKCSLTKSEIAIAADDLAKFLDDLQALESGLTSVKAKIEKCEAEIKIKQRLVRDKCEYRNVDCDIEYNYSLLTVKSIRKDTGEVTEERNMTMSEQQITMDFDK